MFKNNLHQIKLVCWLLDELVLIYLYNVYNYNLFKSIDIFDDYQLSDFSYIIYKFKNFDIKTFITFIKNDIFMTQNSSPFINTIEVICGRNFRLNMYI